jgi:hypothetical protein
MHGASEPNFVALTDPGRYLPQVFELDPPVQLVGFYQSERYFAEYADDIVASLSLPSTQLPQRPSRTPTVGVSFRRGDYNVLGWALPMKYYEDALRFVTERVGQITMVLFGDDPDFVALAAEHLSRFGDTINAFNVTADPIAHLGLMAQCEHHVVANSTLAWWGAWLGDQCHEPDRVVVAPAEYVGGDRVPSRWHTIASGAGAF